MLKDGWMFCLPSPYQMLGYRLFVPVFEGGAKIWLLARDSIPALTKRLSWKDLQQLEYA